MKWWPSVPAKQGSNATDEARVGLCECCKEYATVVLDGRNWLCWEHYRETIQKQLRG